MRGLRSDLFELIQEILEAQDRAPRQATDHDCRESALRVLYGMCMPGPGEVAGGCAPGDARFRCAVCRMEW